MEESGRKKNDCEGGKNMRGREETGRKERNNEGTISY
jgi:hypothetical protein